MFPDNEEKPTEMMPRYLVSFVDKRDKRKYQYVVSIAELPEELPRIPGAGSTSRTSMETRIWKSFMELHPYVRFSEMEIQALASPMQFDGLELRIATQHFQG